MLPSGLPEAVSDDEPLVRFLTQSGHFNATRVKPSAFMPNPKDQETSVFRHSGQPRSELLDLATTAASQRTTHGAAILAARDVRGAGLSVTSAEPPHRHAVIAGWPWNERQPEEQKARQLELALVLADAAGSPIRF
jgi:hypothetical protein